MNNQSELLLTQLHPGEESAIPNRYLHLGGYIRGGGVAHSADNAARRLGRAADADAGFRGIATEGKHAEYCFFNNSLLHFAFRAASSDFSRR
jgi:hypothetical protein